MESLYDTEFNQKLTKYSDNGRVFTEEQLKKYYKFYTKNLVENLFMINFWINLRV